MAGKQRKVKLSTGFDLSRWPSARPTRIPRAISSSELPQGRIPLDFKTIVRHLAIIVAIIFLTYFITITAQFVFNDDYLRSVTSVQVNDEHFLSNLWLQAVLKPLSQPWLRLSLFLDFKSFALDPSWYHLVNILLQMAGCCYFYLLILILARQNYPGERQKQLPYWIAFIPAALLACHPLCCESVAYITGRGGTMVACNVFLSMFSFVFAFLARRRTTMVLGYLFSMGFLTMAIWSGSEALAAPLAILALTLLLKPQSIDWHEWFSVRGPEIGLAILLVVTTPFLLFTGATKDFSNGLGLPTLPAHLYLASQLRALPLYYLRCALVPVGLSVLPPHVISKGGFDLGTLLGLLTVCLTIYLIYKLRRNLFACFGLCLFLFGLLPQACLIQPEIAADRRFYLSIAGLCLLLGQYLAHNLPIKSPKSYAVLALPIVLLTSLAVWRNCAWSSDVTLWRSTLKTNSHSAFAHGMLALALERGHEAAKAKAEAEGAIKSDPDCLPAYFTLAQLQSTYKNYVEASKEYSKVLALATEQHLDTNIVYQSQLGLAEALLEIGRFKEAKNDAASVLDMNSSDIRANLVMGKCLIKMNQPNLALRYLEAGYKLDKMNYYFLEPIAEACLDTGEPRLVANAFGAAHKAFKISPSDNIDRIMAQAAIEIGLPGEALQPIDRLIQRYPAEAKYWYFKYRAAFDLGRKQEADMLKRKALKLNPAIETEVKFIDARPPHSHSLNSINSAGPTSAKR